MVGWGVGGFLGEAAAAAAAASVSPRRTLTDQVATFDPARQHTHTCAANKRAQKRKEERVTSSIRHQNSKGWGLNWEGGRAPVWRPLRRRGAHTRGGRCPRPAGSAASTRPCVCVVPRARSGAKTGKGGACFPLQRAPRRTRACSAQEGGAAGAAGGGAGAAAADYLLPPLLLLRALKENVSKGGWRGGGRSLAKIRLPCPAACVAKKKQTSVLLCGALVLYVRVCLRSTQHARARQPSTHQKKHQRGSAAAVTHEGRARERERAAAAAAAAGGWLCLRAGCVCACACARAGEQQRSLLPSIRCSTTLTKRAAPRAPPPAAVSAVGSRRGAVVPPSTSRRVRVRVCVMSAHKRGGVRAGTTRVAVQAQHSM